MPDLRTIALAAFYLLNGYLTYLCSVSPNPPPAHPNPKDRIRLIATQGQGSILYRPLLFILPTIWTFHALLVLTYPTPPPALCPSPAALNPSLVTWTLPTAVLLSVVSIGACIRILAFRQLGRNFTFQLARPQGLVVEGLYAHVQHPSYTGFVLVFVTQGFLFMRRNGAAGCWLPQWVFGLGQWVACVPWVAAVAVVGHLAMRVGDEEEMMKMAFGKQWEEWHGRTKRFIPGLF